MDNADINFYFDPLCPFAWMTSKWVRQVAAQRDYTVDWRLISLRMLNADVGYDSHFPAGYEAGRTAGLRLLRRSADSQRRAGNPAVGPGCRARILPQVPLDTADWVRLPDRFGLDPARESEWRDLAQALRQAVEEELTEHQRRIFTAIAVNGVPLDALAAELGSSRNAIYKTMFDARRKLRACLVANGYLPENPVRHS